MTVTRRELLAIGGAVVAVGGGVAALRERSAEVLDLAGIASKEGDVLLLLGADVAMPKVSHAGRVAARRLQPLSRGSFGTAAALVGRVRGAQIVVIASAAEALVMETLLSRAGAAPRRMVTSLGELIVGRSS